MDPREYRTCLICDAEFCSEDALKVHTSNMHAGVDTKDIPNQNGMFVCDICDQEFETTQARTAHVTNVHEPDISTATTESETVANVAALEAPADAFACKLCDEKFREKLDEVVHILKVHKSFDKFPKLCPVVDTNFSCDQCDRKFASAHALSVHISHMHSKRVESEPANENGRYSCRMCQRDFKTTRSRAIHVGRVHNLHARRKKSRLSEADDDFISSSSDSVVVAEKDAGKTRCSGRILKALNGLNVAVDEEVLPSARAEFKTSSNDGGSCKANEKKKPPSSSAQDQGKNEEETFLCCSCGESFQSREEWNQHQAEHEEVELSPKKRGSINTTVNGTDVDHGVDAILKNTSTPGDTPIVEDKVQPEPVSQRNKIKKNKRKPTLIRRISPKMVKQEHQGIKILFCTTCRLNFDSVSALNAHILNEHKAERSLTCLFCKDSFGSIDLFEIHIGGSYCGRVTNVRGVYRFACDKCPITFAHPASLEQHSRYDHAAETEKVSTSENIADESPTCTTNSKSSSSLEGTVVDHHSQTTENANATELHFKCPRCPRTFRFAHSRNAHMKSHLLSRKIRTKPNPKPTPTCSEKNFAKLSSQFFVFRRRTICSIPSAESSSSLDEEVEVDQMQTPEDVKKGPEQPATNSKQQQKCAYCDRSFDNFLSRAAHTRVHYRDGSARKVGVHPTKRRLSPTYVVRRNPSLAKLKRRRKSANDVSSRTRSQTYNCMLCPKLCLSMGALRNHLRSHKIDSDSSSREEHRPTPAEVEKSRSVRVHLVRIPVTPANEEQDEQTLKADGDLVGANDEPVTFCCEFCSREFTSSRGFGRHTWYCKRKYSSDTEEADANVVSSDTDPVVVELNEEEEFVCDTCDQVFERRKDLSEHVLAHADPLLLEDPLADEERAETSATPATPVPEGDKSMISCTLCERQFTAERNFSTHMFKKHHKRKGPNGYSPERTSPSSSPVAGSDAVMQTRKRALSPEIDRAEEDTSMEDDLGDMVSLAEKRPRQSLVNCKEALKQYYLAQSELEQPKSSVQFQCHFCGRRFRSGTTLRRHMETECEINETTPKNCNGDDEKVLENGGRIKEELTSETTLGEDYFDGLNHEKLTNESLFEEKMDVDKIADVEPCSCYCCFKKFAFELDVRTHENKPEVMLFCCGICNLYFIDLTKAKEHNMIHTLSKKENNFD